MFTEVASTLEALVFKTSEVWLRYGLMGNHQLDRIDKIFRIFSCFILLILPKALSIYPLLYGELNSPGVGCRLLSAFPYSPQVIEKIHSKPGIGRWFKPVIGMVIVVTWRGISGSESMR